MSLCPYSLVSKSKQIIVLISASAAQQANDKVTIANADVSIWIRFVFKLDFIQNV